MTEKLFWLSDEQWDRVKSLIPRTGPAMVNNRRALSGILYVLLSCRPWRECPADYGPWSLLYRKHTSWRASGLWPLIVRGLVGRGEDVIKVLPSRTRSHTSCDCVNSRLAPSEECASLILTLSRLLTASLVAPPAIDTTWSNTGDEIDARLWLASVQDLRSAAIFCARLSKGDIARRHSVDLEIVSIKLSLVAESLSETLAGRIPLSKRRRRELLLRPRPS
jgi:transposase